MPEIAAVEVEEELELEESELSEVDSEFPFAQEANENAAIIKTKVNKMFVIFFIKISYKTPHFADLLFSRKGVSFCAV